jgi:hypothetical protein
MRRSKNNTVKIEYFRFAVLWFKKLLGYQTFKINHYTICTKDHTITVGWEYQYKEGSMLERAVIEDISFRKFFLELKIYLPDNGRRFTCSHLFVNIGYSGMWRIWDKGNYDIDEWKRERACSVDTSFLDSLPVIEI